MFGSQQNPPGGRSCERSASCVRAPRNTRPYLPDLIYGQKLVRTIIALSGNSIHLVIRNPTESPRSNETAKALIGIEKSQLTHRRLCESKFPRIRFAQVERSSYFSRCLLIEDRYPASRIRPLTEFHPSTTCGPRVADTFTDNIARLTGVDSCAFMFRCSYHHPAA